jgi:hypothetical protein
MGNAMKHSEQLSEDYRKAKQKAIAWGFRPALVAAIAAVVATDKNLIFGIFTPSPEWVFSWVAILSQSWPPCLSPLWLVFWPFCTTKWID